MLDPRIRRLLQKIADCRIWRDTYPDAKIDVMDGAYDWHPDDVREAREILKEHE